MSDQIPKRKIGDKIRVNGTHSTVKRGIANRFGVVIGLAVPPRGYDDDLYEIEFEDDGQRTIVEGAVLFADRRKLWP